MFPLGVKTRGAKSQIPRKRWEDALYDYRVKDKTAREIGAELNRDHSTVVTMFQRMEKKEPSILIRLVREREAEQNALVEEPPRGAHL